MLIRHLDLSATKYMVGRGMHARAQRLLPVQLDVYARELATTVANLTRCIMFVYTWIRWRQIAEFEINSRCQIAELDLIFHWCQIAEFEINSYMAPDHVCAVLQQGRSTSSRTFHPTTSTKQPNSPSTCLPCHLLPVYRIEAESKKGWEFPLFYF